jgi:uncharacterized protein (DUF427 family)
MTTIDIAVFDGFDELDVVGPLEVLRSAGLTVRLVTRAEPLEVTGSHGLVIRADAVYSPGAQVLVFPGGGWLDRAQRGLWGEIEQGDWLGSIKAAADSGVVLASVCTGVMMLAHAGVIGARPAVTHHRAMADLEALGVKVERSRVVDAGGLITAGGVTSGIDLALALVERFLGPAKAEAEARRLEYPWASKAAAPVGPAPSGHRITTEPVKGVARAVWNGQVLAESSHALLLREAGLPPVAYFPPADVRLDLMTPTDLHTRCPFKGDASYWSAEVAGQRADNLAWSYQDPLPERADIAGRVAFFASRLDALEIPGVA